MKLDWRRVILYLTTAGVEGCWLYALLGLLNKQVAGGHLSTPGLLLIYPLSFSLNKLLERLHWSKARLSTINWLAWVAGLMWIVKIQLFSGLALSDPAWLLALPRAIAQIIYTFKPELLVLISSAVLWWLGRRLARTGISFAISISEFQFGLFIMLIVFSIAPQLGVGLGNPVPLALSFFLFSLLGISIAHAQEGVSWLSGLHRGPWSGLLLINIGLVLILGLLISSVIHPDLLRLALAALKWVWELIIKAVLFLGSLLPQPHEMEIPAMPAPEAPPSEGFIMWGMPESVRSGLRIGLDIIWLGIFIVALWRISSAVLSWLRLKLANSMEAEIEPLPGAFRADLMSWLKHILLSLLAFRFPFRNRARTAFPEIASVRHIYRQFLRWAANGGYPRHISQTPYEYRNLIVELLPQAQGNLDLITERYVGTRYSPWMPSKEDLYQLGQAWQRLKQNRLKKRSDREIH